MTATPTDATPYLPTTVNWFDAANNRLKPTVPSEIEHSNAGEMTKLGGWTYGYSAEGQMKTATLSSWAGEAR